MRLNNSIVLIVTVLTFLSIISGLHSSEIKLKENLALLIIFITHQNTL